MHVHGMPEIAMFPDQPWILAFCQILLKLSSFAREIDGWSCIVQAAYNIGGHIVSVNAIEQSIFRFQTPRAGRVKSLFLFHGRMWIPLKLLLTAMEVQFLVRLLWNLFFCYWVNPVAGDYRICGHEEEIRRRKANNQLEVRPSVHPAPSLLCSLHWSCFRSSGKFLTSAITSLERKFIQFFELSFGLTVYWHSAEGLHGPESQRGTRDGEEGLPASQCGSEKIESVPTQSDREVRKGSFHPIQWSPQLGHGECR